MREEIEEVQILRKFLWTSTLFKSACYFHFHSQLVITEFASEVRILERKGKYSTEQCIVESLTNDCGLYAVGNSIVDNQKIQFHRMCKSTEPI